jgi:hypothetical protein
MLGKIEWPFIYILKGKAVWTMAIRVVEFSNRGYKIRKIFA